MRGVSSPRRLTRIHQHAECDGGVDLTEEIGAIADNMFLPEAVDLFIGRHRAHGIPPASGT
jgi:hypothetical protein